ncbi:MAG: hypothetical protein U1E33_05995 [Rhodospirillales bacterium]
MTARTTKPGSSTCATVCARTASTRKSTSTSILPEGGWPARCERQIASADFVLLVCTETYNRRVGGREEPESGLGVLWRPASSAS